MHTQFLPGTLVHPRYASAIVYRSETDAVDERLWHRNLDARVYHSDVGVVVHSVRVPDIDREGVHVGRFIDVCYCVFSGRFGYLYDMALEPLS